MVWLDLEPDDEGQAAGQVASTRSEGWVWKREYEGAPRSPRVSGSAWVDRHGHLDHDFVFVDSGAGLPGVFAKIGEER